VLSGGNRIWAVETGEDQIGSRKFRALKTLSFVRYAPRINARPETGSHGKASPDHP
jgi:hypothetical protein